MDPGARMGRDARSLAPTIHQAVQRQAIKLAWQRDRRIRRTGKYFATFRPKSGWRATVVLELERRHLFPEPHVRDRTESDWRKTLEPLLHNLANAGTDEEDLVSSELCFFVTRPAGSTQSLKWSNAGSLHRKSFMRCHQLRHRDLRAELILGIAEHRTAGLVDLAVLIYPGKETGPCCDRTQPPEPAA